MHKKQARSHRGQRKSLEFYINAVRKGQAKKAARDDATIAKQINRALRARAPQRKQQVKVHRWAVPDLTFDEWQETIAAPSKNEG